MRKGDYGDCMYALLDGEVGVYVDSDIQNCIVKLSDGKVFGEKALDTDNYRYNFVPDYIRGATIKTHQPTSCLVLHKEDYSNVIYHVKNLQRSER